MTQRIAVLVVTLVLSSFLPAAPAEAQELYNYTVTAMFGLGGAPDSDTDDSLSQGSFQLGASLVAEPRTHLALRLGQISFDDEPQGGLFDADLTYATVAGEYRFRETFYDSGIYLGLGGYQLDGIDVFGNDDDETAVGLVLGLTGEFEINRRFGVQVELSGHYTDLEAIDFLVLGHLGLAVHFK